MPNTDYRFPKSGKKTLCQVLVDSGGGIHVKSGDNLARYSCAIHDGSPLFANEFGRYDSSVDNIVTISPFTKLKSGEVIVHIPSLPADARKRMTTSPVSLSDVDKRQLIQQFLISDLKLDKKYAAQMSSLFTKTNIARFGIFAADIFGIAGMSGTGSFVGGAALTGGLAGMGITITVIAGGVLGIAAFFIGSYNRVLKAVSSGFVATQSIGYAYGFTSEIFDYKNTISYPQRFKNATTGHSHETNTRFANARYQAKLAYLASWKTGFADGKKAALDTINQAASTRKMSAESYKIIARSIYLNDPKKMCKGILQKLATESNSYAKSYVGQRIKIEANNCMYPN